MSGVAGRADWMRIVPSATRRLPPRVSQVRHQAHLELDVALRDGALELAVVEASALLRAVELGRADDRLPPVCGDTSRPVRWARTPYFSRPPLIGGIGSKKG